LTVVSHALMPVLAASATNIFTVKNSRQRLFSNLHLIIIGLAGAIPDIVSPHFSLSARHSSLAHTLWFLLAMYPIYLLVSKKLYKNRFLLFTNWLCLATALHLFFDSMSGGIPLFYPFGNVLGKYFIHYRYWVRIDIVILLLLRTMIILLNIIKKRTFSIQQSNQETKSKTHHKKIRFVRLIIAGLTVGFILNASDFYLNGMILGDEWTIVMKSLNLNPITGHVMYLLIIFNLIIGLALISLYAALSPHIINSTKTSFIVGFSGWFFFYFSIYIVNYILGFYTTKIMLVSIIWGLFAIPIATLAGSQIYKFKPSSIKTK